jgi:AcrR family transcriptional regulator
MAARVGLDRRAILEAATELANQHGLEHLSMATLAARLGVRAPTLYHHVAGMAGLRRALALQGIALLREQVGQAIMGVSGEAAVLALAHALRRFAYEHPGLYQAVQYAPVGEDMEWLEQAQQIVAVMVRSLDAYGLDEAQARQVVRMLRSMVHGCLELERVGGFGVPGAAEQTFEQLMVALLGYLRQLTS